MKKIGKVIIQTQEFALTEQEKKIEEVLLAERKELQASAILLRVEQYLNNEIALNVFKKFGVMLRVHL